MENLTKYNLDPYRDYIMERYYEEYSSADILAELRLAHGDRVGNLHKSKRPASVIAGAISKWKKHDEFADQLTDAYQKAQSNPVITQAAIALGERDEEALAKAQRQLIEEQARRKEAERLLKQYTERATVEDRVASMLERQVQDTPYKQRLKAPLSRRIKKAVDSNIEMQLNISDAHFPEVVEPEEAMGLSYNPEVTRKRMEYLVERTARLIEVQGKSAAVRKLTIPVLGDMLSGDIHDELSETNAMVSVEATTEMGYMLFDMGKLLAEVVPEVEMIVLPGNHPRMKKKMPSKKRYNNYEYLMGQITLANAKRVSNLEVKVPKDIIYTHHIFSYKVGMTHGDGSKAASFAGIPFYGLKQRSNANQAMRSRLGLDRHNMLVMGHFHQLLTWTEGDCQIVINGSIKGGDEYGITSRSSAPEAVQALLTFHKERGWINLAKIPLDHIV